MLTFGSLFAGIDGFGLGFERSGLRCAWQVEIDKICQKVLYRQWPNVEKFSDVRECGKHNLARVDVLCGGFPCQDLSIAGRRQGIAGERSGLWFEFIRIIDELKPRYAVIENVPGLLSSNDGKDFAVILRGLVECGYGVAWRILDAQYFGVAQRRRRVFIVGSLGNGIASEILFESEGVPWDPPTRRETGQNIAPTLAGGFMGGGGNRPGINADSAQSLVVARGLNAHQRRLDGDSETFIAGTVTGVESHNGNSNPIADNYVVAKTLTANYGKQVDSSDTNDGPPNLICNTFNGYTGGADDNDAQGNHLVSMPLLAKGNSSHDESLETYIAFDERNITSWANHSNPQPGDPCHTLHSDPPRLIKNGVRRLTPRECERLQSFPDDWTRFDADGKEIADSARYKMLGNAVCVTVAEWIGKRIMSVI